MREMVNKDTRALSSYTTKISTSLSGVSSPRAYEPKIQAFNTGWVLKYSRMVSIISVLIIVIFCKGKNTFFLYTTRRNANFWSREFLETHNYAFLHLGESVAFPLNGKCVAPCLKQPRGTLSSSPQHNNCFSVVCRSVAIPGDLFCDRNTAVPDGFLRQECRSS